MSFNLQIFASQSLNHAKLSKVIAYNRPEIKQSININNKVIHKEQSLAVCAHSPKYKGPLKNQFVAK